MKRVQISDSPLYGITLIPVIGVALIIVVILMVICPIINISALMVDVPEAVTKEGKEENLTVSLSLDGRVSIQTELVENWDTIPMKMRQALSKREPGTVIVIRADKNLPYGVVERLIRAINRGVGRHAVGLATRQRTEKLQVDGK